MNTECGTLIDENILRGKRLLGRILPARCINIGVNFMMESRASYIVSMVSAALVLIAGIYVVFFMPFELTPTIRLLISILLALYLFIRIQYLRKQFKKRDEQ